MARAVASGFNREERKGFVSPPPVSSRHCGHCPGLLRDGLHLLGSGVGKCQGGHEATEHPPLRQWGDDSTGADSNVASCHSLASSQEAFRTRVRLWKDPPAATMA